MTRLDGSGTASEMVTPAPASICITWGFEVNSPNARRRDVADVQRAVLAVVRQQLAQVGWADGAVVGKIALGPGHPRLSVIGKQLAQVCGTHHAVQRRIAVQGGHDGYLVCGGVVHPAQAGRGVRGRAVELRIVAGLEAMSVRRRQQAAHRGVQAALVARVGAVVQDQEPAAHIDPARVGRRVDVGEHVHRRRRVIDLQGAALHCRRAAIKHSGVAERKPGGTRLGQGAIAGNIAAKGHVIRAVEGQGSTICNIAAEAAGGTAVADLQGSGTDRRAAVWLALPVRISVPGPCWIDAPGPEILLEKVTVSERLKAKVPVPVKATLPAPRLPVVPPLPTCNVPAVIVVPAR